MELLHIDVIEQTVKSIRGILELGNHRSCAQVGSQLTFFSTSVKFKFGVFLGEFFESAFIQFSRDLSNAKMSEEELKKEILKITSILINLEKEIKNKNTNEIINQLIDLRYIITIFQIEFPSKYEERSGLRRYKVGV